MVAEVKPALNKDSSGLQKNNNLSDPPEGQTRRDKNPPHSSGTPALRMPTMERSRCAHLGRMSEARATRKPPFGCSGPSMPIEIYPTRISFSPPPMRTLVG